jgi:hypothetical protein
MLDTLAWLEHIDRDSTRATGASKLASPERLVEIIATAAV